MTDGWNWHRPDGDDTARQGADQGAESREPVPPHASGPAARQGDYWWSDAAHDPWRDPSAPTSLAMPGPAGPPPTSDPPPGTGRLNGRTTLLVAVVAVTALLAGLIGGALGVGFATATREPQATLGGSHRPIAALAQRPPQSFAAIAARVLPSVVTVKASVPGGTALGSGFVVSSDGYVLTNEHVVAESTSLSVVLNDGSTAQAKLVGADPESDVAVLSVKRAGLVPLDLGDSSSVQVGDPVLAVGSPLALPGTVTSGIVSAVDRLLAAGDPQTTRYYAAIQTDAAINHGNSGGPLLDGGGQVVGINSVIKSMAAEDDAAGNIGLAFAIPINQAKRLAEEIIATGKARRTVIGARLDTSFNGVRLAQVDRAGPAAAAGLADGDVVLALDGHGVEEPAELIALVRKYPPGSAVTVRYQRGADRKDVTVTLAADAK